MSETTTVVVESVAIEVVGITLVVVNVLVETEVDGITVVIVVEVVAPVIVVGTVIVVTVVVPVTVFVTDAPPICNPALATGGMTLLGQTPVVTVETGRVVESVIVFVTKLVSELVSVTGIVKV